MYIFAGIKDGGGFEKVSACVIRFGVCGLQNQKNYISVIPS